MNTYIEQIANMNDLWKVSIFIRAKRRALHVTLRARREQDVRNLALRVVFVDFVRVEASGIWIWAGHVRRPGQPNEYIIEYNLLRRSRAICSAN